MPVGFSSAARNLFLLGSSGAQVVTNFFESISKASTTDGVFIPNEIRYNYTDQKYVLAGSAKDSNSKGFGWLEKQDYNLETGSLTTDYSVRIESPQATANTTLRAMELDSNDNLIVVGKTADIPWIAKYSNAGVLDWQSTTNTGDVEYTGIISDSNGNYYACGNTPTSGEAQAFVEKFDANGNPGWGKSAFMLGRDVVLEKISANERGEVVAVGFLEDDSADKGYIVKIDTNTGEVLWDRTLERNISGYGGGISPDDIAPANVKCTACYIDSRDQIYVVGTIDGNSPVDNGVGEFLIKYSPEGNIIWQRERDTNHYTILDGAPNTVPFDVKSDGETEQTVVLSVEDYGSFALFDADIFISKYSKNGDLVFRRKISKGGDNLGAACLDADPSFYYILFRDQRVDALAGEPDRYTFGKVSTSGNGLGDFEYNDGTATLIDYTAVVSVDGSPPPENKIGRLSDGSVTNSVSDLMTYPFTANKLLFDDLATQVSNKKRQMDSADSFEYSGSPAIRPADFQELNLLGENNFVGPDLITNGTFDTDTNGWSSGNGAILTVDNTALKISNNGTQISGFATQAITTVPGEQYTVAFEVIDDTSSQAWLRIGNNFGWVDIVNQNNNTTGTYETTFTAEGTLTYITFMVTVGNATRYTIVDNISVKQYKWLDQSGKGNDGGVSGATHNAAGYWEFDGDNDKIVVNSLSNFAPSEVTFEAWFKKPTGSGYKGLVDKGRDNYGAYTINVDETGSKATFTAKISGGNRSVVCATQYGSNVWTHVAGTYDGTDLKIYLNGSLDGTTNIPGVLGSNTLPITIGSTNDGLEYGGEIGEVRIYPRALTAAQVFQNYNATKSKYINEAPDTAPKISDSAIVYDSNLLLNYDFGNPATYDTRFAGTYGNPTTVKNLSSSSYTGTINGATFNPAGYFEFDGTNDDISVSSLPAFGDNDPITIESWVNADTTTNAFQVISTAKATSTHWQLSYTGDPTYNILWAFAGTSNSVGTTTLPSTGAWHHITATYNGGDKTQLASWKVYIDGSEATIQLTGSTGGATNDTIIGHRSGGSTANRFDGNIGEVRIYTRALSATEVLQNFNATRSKYGV